MGMLPIDYLPMCACVTLWQDQLPFLPNFKTSRNELDCIIGYKYKLALIMDSPKLQSNTHKSKIRWLYKYSLELKRVKIIREGHCPYASQVLLVEKGQTSLAYHISLNYKLLNSRLLHTIFPLYDLQGILDLLGRYSWFVHFDIKAGFCNIKVTEKSQPYLEFVA